MQEESRIAILVASVSLLGSLLGSGLSTYLSQRQWVNQEVHTQRKAIVEQRMKLVERLSVSINSVERALELNRMILQDKLDRDAEVFCDQKRKIRQKLLANECSRKWDPYAVSSVQQEQVKLKAEYMSTLQLASLYFPRRVGQQIATLPKDQLWWLRNHDELMQLMVDAAGEF